MDQQGQLNRIAVIGLGLIGASFAAAYKQAMPEGTVMGVDVLQSTCKTAKEKDRVMVIFELEDGTEFKNSVNGDWIEEYPFSKLISQANVKYVKDFKGLKVKFDIRNSEGDTMTFSNIKKISLDE